MKNLICNCCLSGFLYKRAGSKFDNPFFWNRITVKDFTSLMHNFKEISFENISLKLNRDIYQMDKASIRPSNASVILNDKNIRIQFNHCIYDEKFDKPTKVKKTDFVWDIHYAHIYEYIFTTFLRRQERMNKNTKKFFLFVDNARQFDDIDDYYEMFKIVDNDKLDLYFFTSDKSIKSNSEYVHIFYEPINFEALTEKYTDFFNTITENTND